MEYSHDETTRDAVYLTSPTSFEVCSKISTYELRDLIANDIESPIASN
jgi:hypothetical protein